MFISRPVYLERISRWLLLLLAFVPLVVSGYSIFPYIFGKVVLIRLAVTIFLVFFAWYLFQNKKLGRQAWRRLSSNPLVIVATLFLLLAIISASVGVNPYRSFFGNLERGEGLLSLICFWVFFIGAFLFFEKKDWLIFFQLTLLVGIIVVSDAFFDFLAGDSRPDGHFVGSPSFIAAYLFFVIFSALAVWAWSGKKIWSAISGAVILIAIGGIFLTETRGALIGLGTGLLALLVYALWRGKEVNFRWGRRSFNLRVLAGALLLICLTPTLLFIFTASHPVWQNVPGLDRLANLSTGENTTWQTRLLSAGSSLASVNPANESWTRLLFGWGPENFSVAYNLHYNPAYFKYSIEWFDKAHNQVLDVLVTNGLLGLLAYLTLWGLVIYGLLKYCARDGSAQSENRRVGENKLFFSAAGIFFAVAYFVQNLALFDQIATYVPVFAFMALVAQAYPAQEVTDENGASGGWVKYMTLSLSVLMIVMLVWQTFLPGHQMRTFVNALRSSGAQEISASLDKVTRPYTYIQMEVRSKLVQTLMKTANNPKGNELFDRAIALLQETIGREPYGGARFTELLGDAYTFRGVYADDNEYEQYLEMGEAYLRLSLKEAPGRQMVTTQLARNLIQQGKFDEVEKIMDEMLASEPEALNAHFQYGIIIAPYGDYERSAEALNLLRATLLESKSSPRYGNTEDVRSAYQLYLVRFYRDKNDDAFLNTMRRAVELEKLIDEVNTLRLERELIKELPESKAANMEKNMEIFLQLGWDGVTL